MAVRTGPSNRPVTISRWRINVMLLFALLIVVRQFWQLGYIQTGQLKVGDRTLTEMAQAEIAETVTIRPTRGVIRDSKGNVLALDVERESLFVIPQQVRQQEAPKTALVLSSLLGMPAPDIQAKLQDTTRQWVPIKRWLEPEIAERIQELDEPGLQLYYEPIRFYPQGAYAAHVIGAVNREGIGISGVEGFYDTSLKGITGTMTAEWDPQGNPIWLDPPRTDPASDGADIELTLDPLVQHVVETELKKAMDKHSAASATAIVLDPKTGAILGMASYPTFDPNRYTEYAPEMYNQNPAIGRLYEPGSTFKLVTVAAGLQSRAFNADVQVNDTGVIDRYGISLGNWNRSGHGMITPDRVLYHSSNVGALLLNELTGQDNFYKLVREFGYGKPTGVDMAGEGEGIIPDYKAPNFSPIQFDTNAYGQGIAVTPLQQVRMAAAIGNDGKLMRPYIVKRVCHGDRCEETKPTQVGQPIEQGVAWTVRRMMINAANSYGGQVIWGPRTGDYSDAWLVPGHMVAAKTGTSDVPDGQGGYTGQVIGSVVGLAPADNARFAILVKIDQPQGDAYGIMSALPAYQAIADQLLRYARVIPDPNLVGPGQVIGAVQP
jgi:cell division protein FtsI (penicillin-binding protein 3)